MRRFAVFLALLAMALFYALCGALPQEANLPATLLTNLNNTDADGVVRAWMPLCLPRWICNMPNLDPAVYDNVNRCFYPDVSQKWMDMCGKNSQAVLTRVYHMCDAIATFGGTAGIKKRRQGKLKSLGAFALCTEVPKHTDGNDQSIAVVLIYRGPDARIPVDAKYIDDLMREALSRDAGGDFVVSVGKLPGKIHWFEAKADPNRNNCHDNKYVNIL